MDDLFAPPPPPDAADGGPSDTDTPPPPPPPPPPGDAADASGAAPAPQPGPPPAPSTADYGAQPAQPTYQQAYAPPAAQAKSGGGSGKKTLLIVVIAIILLCCCVSVGGGILALRSGVFDEVTSSGVTAPSGMSTNDQGIIAESGTVAVWLSWESGADIDLEIWDSSGEEFIGNGYDYSGDDITDGAMGDEFFEFKSYSGRDFSTGEYVVSVYYFGGDGPPEVPVTVTVQDFDGRIQTFEKNVHYDVEFDQWHAFRIDAATGVVTLLDQWH